MAENTFLRGKRIVLGICGSIAAYKAADLASKLTRAGALIDVVLTASAQRFVSPLTFQALSGRPVYTDMWRAEGGGLPSHIAHIGLAEEADLMVVAPATANTMAKLALGLADDLLSVTALAIGCPLMIAPAMDGGMYDSPAVQANRETLLRRGAYVIEPDQGRFASGMVGTGRLPETADLIGHIRRVLGLDGELAGHKLVVTAGGTREALDPVRFITNRSTGKQGYAIAQAALDAGAEVVLISTTTNLPTPVGARLVTVESAESMKEAVLAQVVDSSALIMAAAVADFAPRTISQQKIKKSDEGLALPLARTPDILMAVKAQRKESGYPMIVVGFAAESENLVENATGKLQAKGLDLLIANDITADDAGFAADTNRVVVLDMDGGLRSIDRTSKANIGAYIIERVGGLLQ
ncbi:MAG: bifunctional phosphopantothenoylcysteine decarboxylase/phosphopantothenate--cysteine ligase CoaBC [Chloroflexi bacterium]|nr:bifunctional phosphopantothenoylcysteine decarboxylase/phosphopantothenate--cysteine ligase CoaBC [Chloroflexota bacterium]